MTTFPTGQYGSAMGGFEPQSPPRTSAGAITSLVLGLLCCIPVVGILAMLVGGFSILSISRSQGRLKGIGLAVAGCTLGLLGTVGYVFTMMGANQAVAMVGTPIRATITAIDTGDYQTARTNLVGTAAGATDEQLKAFAAAYQDELGAVKSTPNGVWGWLRSLVSFFSANPSIEAAVNQASPGEDGLPVVVDFEKGQALVVFVIDQTGAGSATGTATMPLSDVLILTPAGSKYSLLGVIEERGEEEKDGSDPGTGGP